MNNIRHLPRLMVFASVAAKGSFTRAAEELGISKSAVSQQISQLEKELGVRVLNRTTRGVSLTALGEKLLLRCQLLQDQVDLLFTDIVNAGVEPTGRFAVTFPYALESSVVIPAIKQLCAEYTGLEPELIVSDSVMDLVANNLDVAIHVGELPDSSYRALPVGTMTEVFCATPLYLNQTSTPKTPQQLSEHRWIAANWQDQNVPIFNRANNEKSTINLKRFSQANTLPTALDMALRDMGIILLPDVIAKPLFKTGALVHLVENVTGPLWPVYTLHAYKSAKPIHVTRFHQLICLYFSTL